MLTATQRSGRKRPKCKDNCNLDEYLGAEGTSRFDFDVDKDGRVTNVRLRQSSGNADIDRKAEEAIRRRQYEASDTGYQGQRIRVTSEQEGSEFQRQNSSRRREEEAQRAEREAQRADEERQEQERLQREAEQKRPPAAVEPEQSIKPAPSATPKPASPAPIEAAPEPAPAPVEPVEPTPVEPAPAPAEPSEPPSGQ